MQLTAHSYPSWLWPWVLRSRQRQSVSLMQAPFSALHCFPLWHTVLKHGFVYIIILSTCHIATHYSDDERSWQNCTQVFSTVVRLQRFTYIMFFNSANCMLYLFWLSTKSCLLRPSWGLLFPTRLSAAPSCRARFMWGLYPHCYPLCGAGPLKFSLSPLSIDLGTTPPVTLGVRLQHPWMLQ